MKANELMIADWVHISNTSLAQVVMVDQYHIQTTYAKYLIDERKLDPVPLTNKILKSNGFAQNGEYYLLDYNSKDYPNHSELKFLPRFFSFEGRRMENDLWVSKVCTVVKYVHELQHALRVIGLADLADNLKIT